MLSIWLSIVNRNLGDGNSFQLFSGCRSIQKCHDDRIHSMGLILAIMAILVVAPASGKRLGI